MKQILEILIIRDPQTKEQQYLQDFLLPSSNTNFGFFKIRQIFKAHLQHHPQRYQVVLLILDCYLIRSTLLCALLPLFQRY